MMPDLRQRRRSFAADLATVAVLAAVSLALGVLVNEARCRPLPWVYRSPKSRLESAVSKIAPPAAEPARSADLADAPHEIRLEDFQRFVLDREGLVIDARPAAFYGEGHVPGAINLPRETFDESYPRLRGTLEPSKEREIAIYCSGADCPDSSLLADALTKLGYRHLVIYTSGWDEWSQAGLPQEGVPPP